MENNRGCAHCGKVFPDELMLRTHWTTCQAYHEAQRSRYDDLRGWDWRKPLALHSKPKAIGR